MKKPNYNMERKDRDRAKQIKAAAKVEKRAAKSGSGSGGDKASGLDAESVPDVERTTADKESR